MNKAPVLFLAALLVLLLAGQALAQDYAAMIMDIRNGEVVYAEDILAGKKVDVMEFLYEGDVIDVPKGASIVLNYFDSETREEIAGPAKVKVGKSGSQLVSAATAAVKKENLDYLPKKAELGLAHSQNFGNIALRGVDKDIPDNAAQVKMMSMLNTAVRPGQGLTFSWAPVGGATSYVVKVFDDNRALLKKHDAAGTSVQAPAADFAPGKSYFWTVSALSGGHKVLAGAESRFDVLPQARAQEVAAAEKQIESRYQAGSTERLMTLALLYQGANLRDDEAQVLKAALDQRPDNAVIKRRIGGINPNLVQ